MGTVLIVISGFGTFISCGVLIISVILKIIFKISKQTKRAASKVPLFSLIALGVFLTTFIVTMTVGPKLDPVGWCDHEYIVIEKHDATCTNSGYIKKACTLCDNEIDEIIEPYHLWGEESVVEATCTTPKQTKKKCSRCEKTEFETVGDALPHSWVEDSVTEATCLNPKTIVNKCSACGAVKTIEVGSAIAHSFGEWNISTEPTADTEGERTSECSACHYAEIETLPKISYIEVTANELWLAFEENEIAAEQKYKGKTVRVTGIINDINSKGALTSANVLLNVDKSYFGCVQCNFSSQNAAALANVNKGDSVTIEGVCGTIASFNLIIRSCKVIK